ncbi:MAG TPA: FxLYD domain-containing protein [Candidatus Limnocylindrales bacterium]|nr:FxLYD domain-containing protein [Candidatus Limnocylindrales bacterium]
MKKIITVAVLAALILATFAFVPLPCVKAAASEVKVLSYSYYTAPANTVLAPNQGDIVVVGEIENVGTGIVQNVTLMGTALDSTGKTIASSSLGVVWSYEMAPGQKAPFFIDFTPQSSTSQNTSWMSSLSKFTVTVLAVTDTTTSPYPDLSVPTTPFAVNQSNVYTVVGTIVNTGSQTMDYVWVVTTFYNAAGTVVGLNYTYVITPSAALAPTNAIRWVATPADSTPQLTSEIANFSYVIDSVPLGSTSSAEPTLTPTATAPVSSTFPVLPVVVAVVIVVIAVVALLLVRKRQKLPPPPPPPPPPTP